MSSFLLFICVAEQKPLLQMSAGKQKKARKKFTSDVTSCNIESVVMKFTARKFDLRKQDLCYFS